jgi:hypothetical protein
VFLSKLARTLDTLGLALDGPEAIDAALVRVRAAEKALPANDVTTLLRDVERLADFPSGSREARALRAMRALAAVRESAPNEESLTRTFATIYRLVLVFPTRAISELHAESALIRALPVIERLVTSLPPRKPTGSDPGAAGAKVAVLRRLRSV